MPRCPKNDRAFSLLEALVSLFLFAALSLIAVLSLSQVIKMSQRTSARDTAMGKLVEVERSLCRDLANSSSAPGRWTEAPVACGAGGILTGDALALVIPDPDSELTLQPSGQTVANQLVTYYLAVPQTPDAFEGISQTPGADASGYEDQCPYKWLIRKQENQTQVPANWLQSPVIQAPDAFWREASRQVIATHLLQFRIVQSSPNWRFEVRALALADARRKLSLGSVPLSSTRYAITHRFGLVSRY